MSEVEREDAPVPNATREGPSEPKLAKPERQARLLIGVGAAVLFAGIALAVTDDDFGRWLILGGVVTLFVALHRFGRLGPDSVPG